MKYNDGSPIVARIGSDVKLAIQTNGTTVEDGKQKVLNVQSITAKFVNKTKLEEFKEMLKKQNTGRYPIEPMSGNYDAETYILNQSGSYCYNVRPANCCKPKAPCCGCFETFGQVRYDEDIPNKVTVLFPAECQHDLGTYDLILDFRFYSDDYRDDDTAVESFKYEDVVKLVDTLGDTDRHDVIFNIMDLVKA